MGRNRWVDSYSGYTGQWRIYNIKDTFSNISKNIKDSKETCILGDFTAIVGKSDTDSVIGIYGEEIGNSNRQRLNIKSILESNEWILPT